MMIYYFLLSFVSVEYLHCFAQMVWYDDLGSVARWPFEQIVKPVVNYFADKGDRAFKLGENAANAATRVAENTADSAINLGKTLSNPLMIGGILIAAIIILPMVLPKR